MPSIINPCRAKPSARKSSQFERIVSNPIHNTVKLLDASCEMSKFVDKGKCIVNEISRLPKGVNTTKMCNELTSMFDHFDGEVVSVIREEIIPRVRSVGSTNYVHARLKHAATQGSLPPHYTTALISPYVSPQKKRRTAIHHRSLPTRIRNTSTSISTPALIEIQFIKPANEHRFTPTEVCEEYSKLTKDRTKHVNHWLKNKYVPSRSQFFKMLKLYKLKGDAPSKWHIGSGTAPVIDVDTIVAKTSTSSMGRITTSLEVRRILEEQALVTAQERGISSVLVPPSVCDRTVRNYKALAASANRASIKNKVQQKTDSRHTAENSIMSTVSFLMVVAITHLFVGEKNSRYHKYREEPSQGAKMLTRLVSKCNRYAPVYPILPGLIFSTDDSTLFVFKGKAKTAESWYLLQDNGFNDGVAKYNQSVYGNEEGGTDHLNGLRVRLTFTMNATGMLAATFITVTGVSEKELPKKTCPSGVLYIQIPGLCIGAAQDLRHNAVGYVAFYRTERCDVTNKTSEQRNFEYYRENILKPFI